MEEAVAICSGLCKTILECTMRSFEPIHYVYQPHGYSRSLTLVKDCHGKKSLLQGMVFVTCKVSKAPVKDQPIQYLFAKYLRYRKESSWYPFVTYYKLEVEATNGEQTVNNIEVFSLSQYALHWIPEHVPEEKDDDNVLSFGLGIV